MGDVPTWRECCSCSAQIEVLYEPPGLEVPWQIVQWRKIHDHDAHIETMFGDLTGLSEDAGLYDPPARQSDPRLRGELERSNRSRPHQEDA